MVEEPRGVSEPDGNELIRQRHVKLEGLAGAASTLR